MRTNQVVRWRFWSLIAAVLGTALAAAVIGCAEREEAKDGDQLQAAPQGDSGSDGSDDNGSGTKENGNDDGSGTR